MDSLGNKGQIFLIIALFIIIVLVLLRQGFSIVNLVENKKYLESGLDRKELNNVENNIVRTIIFSLDKGIGTIDTNTKGFVFFVQDHEARKTYDLPGFIVHTTHPVVAISTNTTMNITVFNFMKERISNLNISFSYDPNSNQSLSLEDGKSYSTSYSFSTPVDVNYTLTLIRRTATANFTDSIQIPVVIGKSKYVGLFDLKLKTIRGEYRDSFSLTHDLP